MSGSELPTADVLGVEVAVGTVETAADAVIARALSGEGGYAVLCNVHVLMTARKRPDVMEAVRGAWAVFPDGAPIAWLQRREGHHGATRIGGPDLMLAVLDRGREHGLRHALFGSTPDVLDRLALELERRYPGVEIVASVAPPPGQENDGVRLRPIDDASPNVVWVALGAPKQELWMRRHSHDTSSVVLGVGAAFDFHAGTKRRAPSWMRGAGLEWAHRFMSEPGRLAGRYVATNTAFVLSAGRQLVRRRIAA